MKFLETFVQPGNSDRRNFSWNQQKLMTQKSRKHEKFREIAGHSAPELPDFDRKSKTIRQFGVFTKFLPLSKNATLETLSLVKQSELDHS